MSENVSSSLLNVPSIKSYKNSSSTNNQAHVGNPHSLFYQVPQSQSTTSPSGLGCGVSRQAAVNNQQLLLTADNSAIEDMKGHSMNNSSTLEDVKLGNSVSVGAGEQLKPANSFASSNATLKQN